KLKMEVKVSKIFEKYKTWVCSSHETTSQFESTVRILSYAISARSEDSVLSELLYSASNLLVLLNHSILRQTARLKENVPLPQKRIEMCLAIIEYSEVFLELATRKLRGNSGKWLMIVCIHIAKSALRLLLLLKHKSGIQASPAVPLLNRKKELDEKAQQTDLSLEPFLASSADPDKKAPDTFTLKRSGKVVRTLSATPPLNYRSWQLPEEPLKETSKKQLNFDTSPTPLNKHRLWAEGLHISRPLIHLLSLYKFGLKSWKPWLLASAIDISSLFMIGDPDDLTPKERVELKRRCYMLLLYLLRSPFYDKYSKMRIALLMQVIAAYVPGARYIVGPLLNYLPTWQGIYGYVWAT
ncbi:unnamed protein product, partial [Owenia fusiformis]